MNGECPWMNGKCRNGIECFERTGVQKTRVQKDGFGGVGGCCDRPRDATLSAPDEGRVRSCLHRRSLERASSWTPGDYH